MNDLATESRLLPLDAQQPERTQTATFAVG